MISSHFLLLLHPFVALAAELPATGNVLWYDSPGQSWSKAYLPIGNGLLGATISGGVEVDDIKINIDSLWTGGPFYDKAYNGGNHPASDKTTLAAAMQEIRDSIFADASGLIDNITVLTSDPGAYGTYTSAGSLAISRTTSTIDAYRRWLDLDEGVIRSTWKEENKTVLRESFCSSPAQVCVYYSRIDALQSGPTSFSFIPAPGLAPTPQISCSDNSTLSLRSQAGDPGMVYEVVTRLISPTGSPQCQNATTVSNATLSITGSSEYWIVWTGDTNYDLDAGDAAHSYSFAGSDPRASVRSILTSASTNSYADLLRNHISDYNSIMRTGSFDLNLGQSPDLSRTTAKIIQDYKATTPDIGNPYIEWLTFNYGRYLLASSARGTLPANLQGVWSRDSDAPWSAGQLTGRNFSLQAENDPSGLLDYHTNINVQQAYWSAESTDLDVTKTLWDYIAKTWAPRGAETALILYGSSRGWVVHDEIFGHSGMKSASGSNTAQWASYAASAAWMMMHVWDHYDYGRGDIVWWKTQGYPLIKGVASFWLDNLMNDTHFNDGTLVVNPCNSPEQIPITFGCTHWQQLIWELFNAIIKGHSDAGETDSEFLQEIASKRSLLDRGLHIGSWGQLQEWKVDMDSPTDTHRHLSHLIGLYPGYSIASYYPDDSTSNGTTRSNLLDAARTSLIHRGLGKGPDADSGWEKIWRAACYAQLGDAETFYYELNYAVKENFGPNLFSLYNPSDPDPIFQFDANGAYPGAVMNALIQAPDVADLTTPLRITLLPALPRAWSTGHLKGARVRGGIGVDLSWREGKLVQATFTFDRAGAQRNVEVISGGQVVKTFTGRPGNVFSYEAGPHKESNAELPLGAHQGFTFHA